VGSRRCEPGCQCKRHAAATRAALSEATKRRHAGLPPKSKPERKPREKKSPPPLPHCRCGCGQRVKTQGSKYAAGHHFKAKKKWVQGEQIREADPRLSDPMTSACAACGFTVTAPAHEAMEQFRQHACSAA
jgi:hypothetical protein